jgi:hypothetical protein
MTTAYCRGRNYGSRFAAPSYNPNPSARPTDDFELGWREAAGRELAVRDHRRRVRNGCIAEACTELGT